MQKIHHANANQRKAGWLNVRKRLPEKDKYRMMSLVCVTKKTKQANQNRHRLVGTGNKLVVTGVGRGWGVNETGEGE